MSTRRATFLAETLRDAGLKVVEYRGWRTRGRDFTDLRAVVWHHDASPRGDSPGVPDYMLRQMTAGRAGAQLWVDRRGTWHVLAAGVAFHAGRVRAGMPGNNHSLGVETDHTSGEPWPAVQVASLRKGTAAILRHLGQGEDALHMHKTICDPVGRKVDPDGLDLPLERVKVRELLRVKAHATTGPTQLAQEDDLTADQARQLAEVHQMLSALAAPRQPDHADRDPLRVDLGDLLTVLTNEIREVRARVDALGGAK